MVIERTRAELGPVLPLDTNAVSVIANAKAEAISFGHTFYGTEHLLLGMLRPVPGKSVYDESLTLPAGLVLQSLGLSLDNVGNETVRIQGRGQLREKVMLSATPNVGRVLRMATGEAIKAGRDKISDIDILMGIAIEGEGIGAEILGLYDINLEKIQSTINKAPSESKASPNK